MRIWMIWVYKVRICKLKFGIYCEIGLIRVLVWMVEEDMDLGGSVEVELSDKNHD